MADRLERLSRDVLPNGLTTLAVDAGDTPLFAAALSVAAGSRYDPVGLEGLSSLTAAFLGEGTADEGPDDHACRLDRLGVSLEVLPGYETLTFLVTGLTEHLGEALRTTFEMASAPRGGESLFAEVRRIQESEIAEEDDDPYRVCRLRLLSEVFPNHPRGRPSLGTASTVGAASLADVLDFHRTRFAPDHSILAIACQGAPSLVELADRAFSSWSGSAPARVDSPPVRRPRESVRVDMAMPKEQTHIALGHVGVTRDDPDYYALKVMDAILGDSAGFGSRLAARLREDLGLAYVVESDTVGTAGIDPGLFWAYTATSPEHVGAAIEGLLHEIRRMRLEPPSREELSRAIAYLRGRHVMDRETCESLAGSLLEIERFGLGLDYDERHASIVSSVSRQDVKAAAERVLDPERITLVTVGPR